MPSNCMKNARRGPFKAEDIIIGKAEKEKTIQEAHNAVCRAYKRLEALAAELTGALIMITNQLERVGDNRKDAEFLEHARNVIEKSNFFLGDAEIN